MDKNNSTLIWAVIVIAIFFFIIMPMIENCYLNERHALKEALENVSHGPKIDVNKCSRSCCKNNNWPYPEELQPKDMTPEELKNYIPSNFSCNLGSNSGGGCVCLTKENYNYLGSRGSNGSSCDRS